MEKFCFRCKKYKNKDHFSPDKSKKDGKDTTCKACRKKYREENKEEIKVRNKERYDGEKQKEYYKKNKTKILKRNKERYSRDKEIICEKQRDYYRDHIEERAEYNKEYGKKNKNILSQKRREYYLDNRELKLTLAKKYAKDNRVKINLYARNRMGTNLEAKIRSLLATRICDALSGKCKSSKTADLVGCSYDEFILHLESQFPEKMTWEDYRELGWHIDHIIPCAIYDLSIEENQKKCFNYRNLRPLSKEENLRKHARVDMDLIKSYGLEDLLPINTVA